MKWHVYIYYTDIQNCLFNKYKDEYQKCKWTIGPYNVEFSYLSFDTGPSSELAITTTFSRKNENWND